MKIYRTIFVVTIALAIAACATEKTKSTVENVPRANEPRTELSS